MLNNVYFYSMEQPNNSRYHRSNRSSPALAITDSIQLNNYSYQYSPTLSSLSVQCSAYFISRVDLNNYTIETLKQAVDSVVSGPKSKGLKVKLSLPDDGLIINNVPDPSQSWMYRKSELLYFWRDPYYVNIIVVITFNRTNTPYSATIFRLRGNESVQVFLQRAQQFFAQLSSRNIQKRSVERSATTEYTVTEHRKRSKHRSKSKSKSTTKSTHSSRTTPDPHVAHKKSDSKKITTADSISNLYNRRTYSDTTVSSDTRTSNSKKLDDDEKITTISNHLPNDYVIELVREVKELRNEIAALKLDSRITPVRSTSTSPLVFDETDLKEKRTSSQSEIDAETQTDFSLIDNETKMDASNDNSRSFKRKNDQSNTTITKRTHANATNNNGPNREESTLGNSSTINGSSSFHAQEGSQSTKYPVKPRPMIITYENGTTVLTPKAAEKDSSSVPMVPDSLPSLQTGEVVSFRSSFEGTVAPPENIYENIPIFIPIDSTQTSSTNKHEQQNGKPYLYVTITGDQNIELQKEYLSQLFGPQNGISLLIPPGSVQKQTNPSTRSETVSNGQPYFQPIPFSDRLTNPLFNVDKQLLANTIANQFGIDINSPDLQKLVANQHLFVNNKRTFANMIWQITPEEENAICSSPLASNSTVPDVNTSDSNNPTTKPILKPKASSHLPSKGQRISWDSALDSVAN